MNTPLSFFNASTGAAVADMSVACVSQWITVHTGRPISAQAAWNATGTPVGTFSLQFTNDEATSGSPNGDALTATATDYPPSMLTPTPTQPTGGAGNTILATDSIGLRVRLKYVPTSGGTGTTLVAKMDASLRML